MWKVIEGPRAVKLTRTLAERFAGMERFPHDREIQPARLEHIKRVIAEGRFRAPEWATAKCLETGKTYRVNGKHTSTVLSGYETIPNVMVIVTEYECKTLKDVASLYATFDARFSIRSNRDIYMAYAMSCDELRDRCVTGKVINLIAPGIAFSLWENATYLHTAEEKAENLIRHYRFVLWAQDMIGSEKEHKYIWRSPVVAAMFGTYSKDQECAQLFWEMVREGTDNDAKAPSRVLQRYLMQTALSSTDKRNDVKRASTHEMMVKCIHAWNAARCSTPTDLKYYVDAPTPEIK